MERTKAEQLISRFYPGSKLISVIDYKDLYIFNVIPAGIDEKKARMVIRQPVSVNKKTGLVKVFNPLRDAEPDLKNYIKINTHYY